MDKANKGGISLSQKDIEQILARQLAENLAIPIFIVDPSGDMLFYNEPAGGILGRQYHEIESMTSSEWSTVFEPKDQEGRPSKPEELPLMIAMNQQYPERKRLWIRGLDKVLREIDVITLPILAHEQRYLGAAAVFWEVPK